MKKQNPIFTQEKFSNRNINRNKEIRRLEEDCAKARFTSEMVSFALGINQDILSPTRGAPNEALARQIAMYLSHVGFGLSLHRVAQSFGRDRSTIAHACHLIEDKRDDDGFDNLLEVLEESLLKIPQNRILNQI